MIEEIFNWIVTITATILLIYLVRRNTAKEKRKRNKGFPYKRRRKRNEVIEEDDAAISETAYPTLSNE